MHLAGLPTPPKENKNTGVCVCFSLILSLANQNLHESHHQSTEQRLNLKCITGKLRAPFWGPVCKKRGRDRRKPRRKRSVKEEKIAEFDTKNRNHIKLFRSFPPLHTSVRCNDSIRNQQPDYRRDVDVEI